MRDSAGKDRTNSVLGRGASTGFTVLAALSVVLPSGLLGSTFVASASCDATSLHVESLDVHHVDINRHTPTEPASHTYGYHTFHLVLEVRDGCGNRVSGVDGALAFRLPGGYDYIPRFLTNEQGIGFAQSNYPHDATYCLRVHDALVLIRTGSPTLVKAGYAYQPSANVETMACALAQGTIPSSSEVPLPPIPPVSVPTDAPVASLANEAAQAAADSPIDRKERLVPLTSACAPDPNAVHVSRLLVDHDDNYRPGSQPSSHQSPGYHSFLMRVRLQDGCGRPYEMVEENLGRYRGDLNLMRQAAPFLGSSSDGFSTRADGWAFASNGFSSLSGSDGGYCVAVLEEGLAMIFPFVNRTYDPDRNNAAIPRYVWPVDGRAYLRVCIPAAGQGTPAPYSSLPPDRCNPRTMHVESARLVHDDRWRSYYTHDLGDGHGFRVGVEIRDGCGAPLHGVQVPWTLCYAGSSPYPFCFASETDETDELGLADSMIRSYHSNAGPYCLNVDTEGIAKPGYGHDQWADKPVDPYGNIIVCTDADGSSARLLDGDDWASSQWKNCDEFPSTDPAPMYWSQPKVCQPPPAV